MPVELLIRATNGDIGKRLQKGEIVTQRDVARLVANPWGAREVLPDYVKIRITDATEEQVIHYQNDITDILQWELLASNAQGRRYRVYLLPQVLVLRPGMKAKYRDFIIDNYNAVIVSSDLLNGEFVIDIPNTDYAELAQIIRNDLEERVADARYYINPGVIDYIVNQGGWVKTDKATLLTYVMDRLA